MIVSPPKSQFHQADDKHLVIQEACVALANGNLEKAKQIIKEKYPFEPTPKGETHWPMAKPIKEGVNYDRNKSKREEVADRKKMEIWLRDGFTDRYTGQRLVYPRVLEILTEEMPKEFPVCGNWIMESTHIAYYDLSASVDHVEPIARGGDNELNNLITTSFCNNKTKSEFLLNEIGEQLLPPGDLKEWDGLFSWYGEYLNRAERSR